MLAVSFCSHDTVLQKIDLEEDEELLFISEVNDKFLTHLLIEVEGYRPLKWMNGSMPLQLKVGTTIKLRGFGGYIMKEIKAHGQAYSVS